MNGTVIGIVLFLGLGAIAAVEGKLLLNAHEKIGDLRVEVVNKQAIIDMKNKDADLSKTLVDFQTHVTTAINTAVTPFRQGIINAIVDPKCVGTNDAFVAASAGVRAAKAGIGPRRTTP